MTARTLGRRAERDRRTSARHHRSAHLPGPGERRVDVADDHDERERADVLDAPFQRLAAGVPDLDDLHARAHCRRPADRPADLRVGKAEHVPQRRVRVGVGRRPGHVEADAVAVERDRLVEVADDRAEEVPGSHDRTAGRRTRRRQSDNRRLGPCDGGSQQHGHYDCKRLDVRHSFFYCRLFITKSRRPRSS